MLCQQQGVREAPVGLRARHLGGPFLGAAAAIAACLLDHWEGVPAGPQSAAGVMRGWAGTRAMVDRHACAICVRSLKVLHTLQRVGGPEGEGRTQCFGESRGHTPLTGVQYCEASFTSSWLPHLFREVKDLE